MILAGIERSPKIFDFRASGIPVQKRVDFFDTLRPPVNTGGLYLLFGYDIYIGFTFQYRQNIAAYVTAVYSISLYVRRRFCAFRQAWVLLQRHRKNDQLNTVLLKMQTKISGLG